MGTEPVGNLQTSTSTFSVLERVKTLLKNAIAIIGSLTQKFAQLQKPSGVVNFQPENVHVVSTDITVRCGDNHLELERSGNVEGRGQVGGASFFRERGEDLETRREFMVKEDDPATVLLEGSAGFVKKTGLVPGCLMDSVVFAESGTVIRDNSETSASIQPKVPAKENQKITGWDTLAFGRKRRPKTPMSTEGFHFVKTSNALKSLTSKAQWDLAGGIMISQAVGDESLHFGQFMAITEKVDEQDQVVGLRRIDLGARERFARARMIRHDLGKNQQDPNPQQMSPFSTSIDYSGGGQFMKDYVGFLVKEPGVKFKLALLWATAEVDRDSPNPEVGELVGKKSEEEFLEQLQRIPEKDRGKAILDVASTITKNAGPGPLAEILEKSPEEIRWEVDGPVVAQFLGVLATKRAIAMKEGAIKVLFESMRELAGSLQGHVEVIGKILPDDGYAFYSAVSFLRDMKLPFLTAPDGFATETVKNHRDNLQKVLQEIDRASKDPELGSGDKYKLDQARTDVLQAIQLLTDIAEVRQMRNPILEN